MWRREVRFWIILKVRLTRFADRSNEEGGRERVLGMNPYWRSSQSNLAVGVKKSSG